MGCSSFLSPPLPMGPSPPCDFSATTKCSGMVDVQTKLLAVSTGCPLSSARGVRTPRRNWSLQRMFRDIESQSVLPTLAKWRYWDCYCYFLKWNLRGSRITPNSLSLCTPLHSFLDRGCFAAGPTAHARQIRRVPKAVLQSPQLNIIFG